MKQNGAIKIEQSPNNPVGYKQTEVGAIPHDWNLKPLGHLIFSVEYGSSSKSKTQGQVPVLRMGNLQNGKINWSNLVFTDNFYEIKKYQLYAGDVLFNRTNTPDLVGKTSIYKGEFPAIFAGYLIRISVDKSLLDSRFLNYILNTEFSKKYSAKVLSIAVGQANINSQKLKTYPIPLPPTFPEQHSIATALSDADAYIESLEKLIAKKRAIKKGVMQELLTGKRRLPGFSREWKPWTILKIAPCIIDYRGRTPLKLGMEWGDGDIPALSARNVKMGWIDFHEETYFGSDALYKRWMTNGHTRKDDLVITTEAPLGNIALIPDDRKYILSQRTILLQVDPSIASSQFLFQLMMGSHFQQVLAENSSGSTATGIQRKRFEKLELTLPELPEQTAIAALLSDIDSDITAHEAKLSKARLIKQGMMQELLTGRIRLI